jgi:hypothetical protein
MKTKLFALVLSVLLTIPCALRAEEVVIPLMEVVGMGTLPGDGPLDSPDEDPTIIPRPNSFHATINGHALSVTKLEPAIPSAQATVVNASTGSIVLNQQFTNSVQQQISNTGVYVLHITTDGGSLVGQFIVQ